LSNWPDEIAVDDAVTYFTLSTDYLSWLAGAVRFPSRLDGNPCVALFEGSGTASLAGDLIALTDPPPEQLTNVTAPWGLMLEPAP
jgi:hypothetical protein